MIELQVPPSPHQMKCFANLLVRNVQSKVLLILHANEVHFKHSLSHHQFKECASRCEDPVNYFLLLLRHDPLPEPLERKHSEVSRLKCHV